MLTLLVLLGAFLLLLTVTGAIGRARRRRIEEAERERRALEAEHRHRDQDGQRAARHEANEASEGLPWIAIAHVTSLRKRPAAHAD